MLKKNGKKNRKGEGMVSYLIVLGLVVLVCFTAAKALGGSIKNVFNTAEDGVHKIDDEIKESTGG